MVRTLPSSRACRRRSIQPDAWPSGLALACWPAPTVLVLPENRLIDSSEVRASVHHLGQHAPVRAAPRLLVIVTLAEAGGAQTFAGSLLHGLKGRWDVEVAAHGPEGALVDACRRDGVPFHH